MAADPSSANLTATFGANEWLIDEMRDAWRADPSSVTQQWRSFFEEEARANGSLAPSPATGASTPSPDANGNTPPPRHPQRQNR